MRPSPGAMHFTATRSTFGTDAYSTRMTGSIRRLVTRVLLTLPINGQGRSEDLSRRTGYFSFSIPKGCGYCFHKWLPCSFRARSLKRLPSQTLSRTPGSVSALPLTCSIRRSSTFSLLLEEQAQRLRVLSFPET